MDRAYEGDETRQLAVELGYVPVVPPKNNRRTPWDYDHALYKRCNEIERLFCRLNGFRRLFSCFDKPDHVRQIRHLAHALQRHTTRRSEQPSLAERRKQLIDKRKQPPSPHLQTSVRRLM